MYRVVSVIGNSIRREMYFLAFELENKPENKLPPITCQHVIFYSGIYSVNV